MRVLVTGATNGMGKGVARAIAARDDSRHEIILLGRSAERGEATVQEIRSARKNPNISFVRCDLARLRDVKKVIAEIHAEWRSLDCVFINAGLGYAPEREVTEDGMVAHFQVNYLSQFMLTLHLLDLLRRSEGGGRVVFNVTGGGDIFWEDMQLKKKWSYEAGIQQSMVAKRMFYRRLHDLSRQAGDVRMSFYGFEIPKTVWSNQVNIIPGSMRAMATVVKWFGGFLSIDECGEIMAPLFLEDQETSFRRSGKFITATKAGFVEKEDVRAVSDQTLQQKLWNISLDLCNDGDTRGIAEDLASRAQRGGDAAPSAPNISARARAEVPPLLDLP